MDFDSSKSIRASFIFVAADKFVLFVNLFSFVNFWAKILLKNEKMRIRKNTIKILHEEFFCIGIIISYFNKGCLQILHLRHTGFFYIIFMWLLFCDVYILRFFFATMCKLCAVWADMAFATGLKFCVAWRETVFGLT